MNCSFSCQSCHSNEERSSAESRVPSDELCARLKKLAEVLRPLRRRQPEAGSPIPSARVAMSTRSPGGKGSTVAVTVAASIFPLIRD
ncbi:GD16104 [Drosophila simulans]|uniref:GD16104 n=1 Tax=Drosophila simulans TaxID=7240 RepID=B4R6K3_DROSI|nr:GD16104 [Drosophila simulans]